MNRILSSVIDCLRFLPGTSFVVPSLGFDDSSYPVIVKIISTQSDTIVSLPAHNRTVHIVNSAEKVTVELIERDGSLFLHSTKPVVVFVFTASAKVCLASEV